jgi:methylmalonyl-CoA/ethylmalonyl-CoA epimerase
LHDVALERETPTEDPMNKPSLMSALAESALCLDHVAIAVPDLEASIAWYQDVLGFELKERRTTEGSFTGMVSAVMKAGPITAVLVQGTSPESQVSRYVEHYGPGLQHMAIEVRDLRALTERLEAGGVEFATNVIEGTGIRQIFTAREPSSGMMFELIEREDDSGHFSDESVRSLFRQLEEKDAY